MIILQGVLAGLVGGLFMGAASEAFYRLGVFRSNILIIDGAFVTRFLKGGAHGASPYLFGIPVHLLTSTTFGVAYLVGAHVLTWDPRSIWILAAYVAFLWVSMLFVALPVAGQGVLGKKGGPFAWAEQLLLHIFFGLGLWLALAFV
ncbi:MAG: hypothetical protein SWE60_07690 [Thermodesulfobacteriota bacterium]|nr:hypothetical protein [Thermodesulfobacteriota bacterium]